MKKKGGSKDNIGSTIFSKKNSIQGSTKRDPRRIAPKPAQSKPAKHRMI